MALAAIITAITLYSCCCCLYNSLILTFCDRDTLQRAYFVGTIISNSSSCIFLVIIALALHGHAPTIAFTREAYIFGFMIALFFAYPLWLHVPEAEAGERAEPVAPSNAVMAIVSGVQALAKNRCDTTNFTSFRPVIVLSRHLSPWQRPRIKIIFCRELLKFALASFILQDGMSCLFQINTIYASYVGVSVGNLIVGQVCHNCCICSAPLPPRQHPHIRLKFQLQRSTFCGRL